MLKKICNLPPALIKNIGLFLIIVLICILLFYFRNILSHLNTQVNNMSNPANKPSKVVVFDLDETLGCFTEIGIFWDALEKFYNQKLTNDKFVELLNIFPEFCRPNILKILEYLQKKKKAKSCLKIMIYTNNQGPKSWVKMITDYFDYKLGYNVFDQIIGAYKVGGKIIEEKRTSHEKSVKDLISCTQLAATTEFCFIDDLYHPLMDKDNVFYINVKPYRYSMSYDTMATRYYDLVINAQKNNTIQKEVFVNSIINYMKQYNYMVVRKSIEEEKTDKVVSKKLMSYLEDFFKRGRTKNTRKHRLIKNRKTKYGKRYYL